MIKKRDRPNRLQPSLKESLKEEQEILKIVEEKKNVKYILILQILILLFK